MSLVLKGLIGNLLLHGMILTTNLPLFLHSPCRPGFTTELIPHLLLTTQLSHPLFAHFLALKTWTPYVNT